MKFDWRRKTAVYIGRFQPFHFGHKMLFLKALRASKQVCILVMDSYGVNKKNPYKFNFVKNKINQALKEYKDKFIIIKIPVVSSLIYGRKVGYKIKKINLNKNIEEISATKIRKKLKI